MISTCTYSLPFTVPFNTGNSIFTERKGVIIQFSGDVEAIAEASPLPGFSKESLSDVQQFFNRNELIISTFFSEPFTLIEITPFLDTLPNISSVQYALSMLALSILAQRENRSLDEILQMNNPPESIRVNGVIGAGNKRDIFQQVEKLVTEGFTALKFKATNTPAELATAMKMVHSQFPDLTFRLDANQSWPLQNIAEYSSLFSSLPVEYIEEPCAASQEKEFVRILRESKLPIALDESIKSIEHLEIVLKKYPNLYLILKPSLFGNFLRLRETISRYRSSFDQIVVTTTLESAVGRLMAAEAAFLIGDRSLAHGLHTGHLLAQDLMGDLSFSDGKIKASGRQFVHLNFDRLNQTFLTF